MSRRVAIVGLLVLGCGAPPRTLPGQLPPAATLQDPMGGSAFVAAERYRGRVVVLDFWASWCDECERSIPAVSRLAATYADRGLIVVGINVGEEPADVPRLARALGIDYPIAVDPDLAFSDSVGASKLPLLLVVDRTGAIVHRATAVDAATLDVIQRLLPLGE